MSALANKSCRAGINPGEVAATTDDRYGQAAIDQVRRFWRRAIKAVAAILGIRPSVARDMSAAGEIPLVNRHLPGATETTREAPSPARSADQLDYYSSVTKRVVWNVGNKKKPSSQAKTSSAMPKAARNATEQQPQTKERRLSACGIRTIQITDSLGQLVLHDRLSFVEPASAANKRYCCAGFHLTVGFWSKCRECNEDAPVEKPIRSTGSAPASLTK